METVIIEDLLLEIYEKIGYKVEITIVGVSDGYADNIDGKKIHRLMLFNKEGARLTGHTYIGEGGVIAALNGMLQIYHSFTCAYESIKGTVIK